MKKFLAFTLAETLIVMGIIGIVSALTLPNLNSSTGEKEKVAKVKKLYQNFEDAIGRAQAVYGPVSEWFINDTTATAQITRFGDRVTEFMKVSKNCGTTTNQKCFSNTKELPIDGDDGSESGFDSKNTSYKFQLADGTSVSFQNSSWISDGFDLMFNIDGPKGKNQYGNDIFALFFDKSSNEIKLSNSTYFGNLYNSNNGHIAAAWVINYDNMDYLKASNNGKCKNSNVTLSLTANPPVTSCK